METEVSSPGRRYVTLQDYLRLIRRYGVMIAALTVLGGVLGYLDAKRQTPVYQATASVSFTDPSRNLDLVGFGSSSTLTPTQLAAAASEAVIQPRVMRAASRRLHRTPPGAIAGVVSSTVSPNSGNLQITASWSNPASAARIANAVADAIVADSNRAARANFSAIGRTIQARIAKLQRTASGRPSAASTTAQQQLLFYDNELARVDTLGHFARSAQVQAIALPSGAPTSPNTSRSTGLGVALGLLLGLVFAFLRDNLDRRLRHPRDVESSFDFPVLGYVRNQAMGRVPYRANGSKPGDHQLDIETFRIVRRNLDFLTDESRARSVLITSSLAEEGKTTVATSLAYAMATAGKRTLVVDCDLRRPALSTRLGVSPSPGLAEFLAGEASPASILRTVPLPDVGSLNGSTHANGDQPANAGPHEFVCIPAGHPTSATPEALGSDRFRTFLEQVSEAYQVVILDSSPLLPVADTLEMLPHVDAVIVCARESQTTSAEASAAQAALAQVPQRPIGLVVTGVKARRDIYASYY